MKMTLIYMSSEQIRKLYIQTRQNVETVVAETSPLVETSCHSHQT